MVSNSTSAHSESIADLIRGNGTFIITKSRIFALVKLSNFIQSGGKKPIVQGLEGLLPFGFFEYLPWLGSVHCSSSLEAEDTSSWVRAESGCLLNHGHGQDMSERETCASG